MDQWTARSINLLTGKRVVKLDHSNTVSIDNDVYAYREFCQIVCAMAKHLGATVEDTEMRLFSQGRGKGMWRNHVKGNK